MQLLYSMYACVCMCMRTCMHMCVCYSVYGICTPVCVAVSTYIPQSGLEEEFCSKIPPFSLETGSLPELEWDQQSPESLCFPSPTMLGLQTCEVHDHTQFFPLVLGYKHRYIPCAYGESPYLLSYLSRPHNTCVLGAVLRVEGYLHESPRKIHSPPPLCWGPTVLTRHTLTPWGERKMAEYTVIRRVRSALRQNTNGEKAAEHGIYY